MDEWMEACTTITAVIISGRFDRDLIDFKLT